MSVDRRGCSIDVREVTLLEDRALVRRIATVALRAGRNRLFVDGVSPLLIDKSLLAEIAGTAASLVDVRVERERTFGDDGKPEDIRHVAEEARMLRDLVRLVQDEERAKQIEVDGLDQLLAAFVREVSVDAAWARLAGEDRSADLGALIERSKSARGDLAATRGKLLETRKSLARKLERKRLLRRPTSRLSARIELEIDASEEATVELVIAYVVPNACWRPRHRAVLDDGAGVVTLSTEAVVWQNTGEVWESAKLSLSTERPSLGKAPPRLETDALSLVRKGALIVETRQQQVEEAGLGAGEGGLADKRAASELPGIDDGGEPQRLSSKHRATIPSDGRPHAVPLFSFASKAELSIVAMPELVQAALLKTTLVNAGDHPLLAGPVELVRRGGHVGRTMLPFIAPGEKLTLGWGPDPGLRVHRETEQLKDESGMLSSWVTRTQEVRVRLSNLSPDKKTILVRERVPISELEKVQIAVIARGTSEEKTADANGFISWTVELAPFARKLLKLQVATKKHSDVVG